MKLSKFDNLHSQNLKDLGSTKNYTAAGVARVQVIQNYYKL